MNKIVYFVPAICWAILIWSLSTTSNLPPIPWDFLSPDKIGHLVFYAVQTFLLIWAFAKSQEWKEIKVVGVVLAMLIAASYGTSLEFVQANIPGRAFDYADMVANFVGTFIGAYSFKLLVASYK